MISTGTLGKTNSFFFIKFLFNQVSPIEIQRPHFQGKPDQDSSLQNTKFQQIKNREGYVCYPVILLDR